MKFLFHDSRISEVTSDSGKAYVFGGFWVDQTYYFGESAGCYLLEAVLRMRNKTDLTGFLRSLNGAFMFCVHTENLLIAAVDRVRSFPLYWSKERNALCDKLIWKEASPDLLGCVEFLSSSYTLNNRTIFEEWISFGPGEYLWQTNEDSTIAKYYTHTHRIKSLSEEEIAGTFQKLGEEMITRTVKSLGGKKILLPLSGGYDSRYLACLLKEYGFNDIETYTYGAKSSYEVKTSKAVAEKLGYSWNYVEYDFEYWTKLLDDGTIDAFLKFGFMGDGCPCLQEIPALDRLSKMFPAEEYCVLPGYCGDLFGGSYLLPQLGEAIPRDQLSRFLYEKHFVFRRNTRAEKAAILWDLSNGFHVPEQEFSYAKAASLNENWFVEHKVSKFVVNALRMHEFYGYDWRLPLWDSELVDFWYSVPLKYRGIERNLYHDLLVRDHFTSLGVVYSKPASFSKKPSSGLVRLAKELLKNANAYTFMRSGRHLFSRQDINGTEGFDRKIYQSLQDKKRICFGKANENTYLSRRVLERVETSD